MARRFQFSLRMVFVLTTLAALAGAAWHPLVRIWDSLDLLAVLLLIAVPMFLPPLIFLAILPFAYGKSVREVANQRVLTATEEGNR